MKSAPRDGTIIEVQWFGRGKREYHFRTRWLAPCKLWVDWDRQHVELTNLKGWRAWPVQYRLWTAQEEDTLAQIHHPETVRYLDPAQFL